MAVRKPKWKLRATSLAHGFELCGDHAAELRRPAKVMADLMAVELKTYYRWISECSMPVNRIRQFETLCGASFVSDYLALAGGKMVIDMPTGKRADERDLAELQALTARAIALLIDFYAGHAALGETSEALNGVLTGWSFHRANVVKLAEPELDFNQGE